MKTAFNFTLLALAAGLAAPAQAQDDSDFTGPRVEGRLGYEFVSASVRNIQDFQGRGSFGDDSTDENKAYGVEVGYDAQVGKAILGAYVSLDSSDTEIRSTARPYYFYTGRNITAGVRAGIETRGALVYAKGGYSNGRLVEDLLTGANPALFADYKRSRNGFHLGGGFELPVSGGFYTKLDYTYHQYNKADIGITEELQFNRHQILTGFGYRF